MTLVPDSIKKLASNALGMDPCTSISRITALKHMTVKTIMHLMKLFNYKQIKLDEETRKKLSDVDIIYLQDLGIN